MARAIDGELLELEIANIANKLAKSDAQKALMGRVMYCVEHIPTLTPPNHFPGCRVDGERDPVPELDNQLGRLYNPEHEDRVGESSERPLRAPGRKREAADRAKK